MHPSLCKLALDLSDQNKRDIGTAGYLGGATLFGDTARTGVKAMDLSEKLMGQATRMIQNPNSMLDAHGALSYLKEYGDTAGGLSKLRIMGIPAGRILGTAPIGVMMTPHGVTDVIKAHLGGRGLSKSRYDSIKGQMDHYKGFVTDPQTTLMNEVATGGAKFDPSKLKPIASRVGLNAEDYKVLTDGKMADPLMQFEKMVKLRKPGANPQMDTMANATARYLFAGGARPGAIRRGVMDIEKARNFGPGGYGSGANAASKLLIPLGILGSAGLGAIGTKRLYNDHINQPSMFAKAGSVDPDIEEMGKKKDEAANSFKQWWDHSVMSKPTAGDYAVDTGLLAGGGAMMHRATKYAPSNLIAVTAGRLLPPLTEHDVGAGHVTPAKAIYEALQQHPAIQSGEFMTDIALREMDPNAINPLTGKPFSPGAILRRSDNMALQKPFRLSNIAKHHNNNALVTLDSGFGATVAHSAGGMWWRKPEFNVNPSGRLGFFPDSTNKISNNLRVIMHGNPSDLLNKTNLIGFGQPSELAAKGYGRIAHYPVHPALQDSVLNMAQERLTNPKAPAAVWGAFANRMEATGDLPGATQLRDALSAGKHIVTVSGSSRGDYVAQRINEMATALKRDPEMASKIQLVGLLGGSYGTPTASKLMEGAGAIGLRNTDKYVTDGSKALYELINASSRHYGPTGASAFAEAQLSRTPSEFVTDYNPMKERMLDGLKKMHHSMTDGEARALHALNLNEWNNGTQSEVARGLRGNVSANTGEEFIGHMREMLAGHRPSDRTGEALDYLRQAKESKKQMADEIINFARRVRGETVGKMTRRLAGGGVMAALGGVGLYDALKRQSATPQDLFKSRMVKL